MDQSSKDTLLFCIEFVKNNMREHSQNAMCRTWLKTATDILDRQSDLGSADYIKSELSAVDNWLSGKDGTSTSEDMATKLQTAEMLLKDA